MSLEHPTLAELLRHAEKFGTEQVYETAERYLNGAELLQLDRELTRIDTERRKRFGTVPKRKRMSNERRLQLVDFLIREGLPTTRIAAHLGVSVRRVEQIRQELRAAAIQGRAPELSSRGDENPQAARNDGVEAPTSDTVEALF